MRDSLCVTCAEIPSGVPGVDLEILSRGYGRKAIAETAARERLNDMLDPYDQPGMPGLVATVVRGVQVVCQMEQEADTRADRRTDALTVT
jgi:hypothetical protein